MGGGCYCCPEDPAESSAPPPQPPPQPPRPSRPPRSPWPPRSPRPQPPPKHTAKPRVFKVDARLSSHRGAAASFSEGLRRTSSFGTSTTRLPKLGESSNSEEEEDICTICYDGYDAEKPKFYTNCHHHFHRRCIRI